jgi:polyisoprenoid-binding protein YceI
MLKQIFLALALGSSGLGWSQHYTITDTGSSVKFAIRNMGLTVNGSFSRLKGTLHFDPNELTASRVTVAIEAGSIDTGIDLRNKHLKKEAYFAVATYPEIRFVSTKITNSAQPEKFTVTGKLTIKKATKEVKFDFSTQKQNGNYVCIGELVINRRDYEIGGSSFTMADEVKVFLSITANPIQL